MTHELAKRLADPEAVAAYSLIRVSTQKGDPKRDAAWAEYLQGSDPLAIIAAARPDNRGAGIANHRVGKPTS